MIAGDDFHEKAVTLDEAGESRSLGQVSAANCITHEISKKEKVCWQPKFRNSYMTPHLPRLTN
jgi:hypothetical protein